MFDMAKKSRADTESVWRDSEDLYMGNHWKGFKMPNYQNQVTLELIASSIDTMVPVLSSRPPKIDVMPVEYDDITIAAAQNLQATIDELWIVRDLQNMVPEWLLDFLIYGTGILKVRFNEDDDMPDADVVDPFAFYVNPSATKLEDAEWVMQASPMPMWKVKDMYENGEYVESQGNLEKYEAMKMNTAPLADERIQVTDTKGQETHYFDSAKKAMERMEERALVIECFMRDGTHEYVDMEDESGKAVKKKQYKYPTKVRQVVMANGVLLYDGPTKYPFFNKRHHLAHPFPYIVLKNSGSAHSFWGKPEPRRLKSLNLAMDRIASQIADNIHLTSNPMWVVDETADVVDQISNKPGAVVRKKGPGQVSMQSPASMPGYVFNFYELLYDMMETVSGVNKATQGKEASNVTSGVQAQIYRQAATTKIDFKSRSLDQAIQTLGSMWIAAIQNMSLRPHSVQVVLPTQIEEQRSFVGIEYQGMQFNVRAKAGSMLPENKMYVENKILQLAQMGLIQDPEFIIENVDLPGKEALLQKMRGERAAEADAEQQRQSPLSEEELAGLGGDEDEIYRQMTEDPELAERMLNMSARREV
jgi:hypothetical protein